MTEILRRENSRKIFVKFPPASLLGVSAGYCQRSLEDESGMIRTQLGMHNKSENGRSAWNALYDTTPWQ
jgi:hypothetical protein